MNKHCLALAIMALVSSAPGWAATCTSSFSAAQELSVVTLEMRRPALDDTACITAQEVVARALRRSAPAAPAAKTIESAKASAAAYVPKTKDDNTPWRFDMNQNGKRMTAEQFDAWMKAKGIRVATGKPAAAAVADQSSPDGAGKE